MAKFTELPWVHSYLWPTAIGLTSAVVTALVSDAPSVLADGLQSGDLAKLAGIAASGALGFLAVIMQRYAGSREPWVQPKKDPDDVAMVLRRGDAIQEAVDTYHPGPGH